MRQIIWVEVLCSVSEFPWPLPGCCLPVLVTALSSLGAAGVTLWAAELYESVHSSTVSSSGSAGWKASLTCYGQSSFRRSSCAHGSLQLPWVNLTRWERQGGTPGGTLSSCAREGMRSVYSRGENQTPS